MKKWIWLWCTLIVSGASIAAKDEKPITLDKAIQGAQAKIEAELAQGTKIILLNFNAPTEKLSEYVIDQLVAKLVNNKKLTVVERKDLNLINEEMAFQLSGEVSDESAQAIGKKYGAQSIASGKFDTLGDLYQFSIKTLHVESATIELFYQTPIKNDKKVANLLGITDQKEAEKKAKQNTQQLASRNTKLILGVRGGIGGISVLGNQAGDLVEGMGTNAAPLFPEQVYSVYFGTHSVSSLIGFQVEGNFYLNTGMSVTDTSGHTVEFSYTSLDIPVLVRLGVGGGGMFCLFGGPYVSIPLSKLTTTSASTELKTDIAKPLLDFVGTYGILGGLSMGFKVGPGYFAIDGRYKYDFNSVTLKDVKGSLFKRQGF
ncbi:MAG: penicillin-binding protein activator LpoB, partial [Treponema sp.]|nr:penicillin-binding protein activator LpoB [Treponema sp.]